MPDSTSTIHNRRSNRSLIRSTSQRRRQRSRPLLADHKSDSSMAPNAVLQSAFIRNHALSPYTSATAYFPATTFGVFRTFLLLILKPLTGQYASTDHLQGNTARIALTKLPVFDFLCHLSSSPLAYSCFTAARPLYARFLRDWRHHADLLYLILIPCAVKRFFIDILGMRRNTCFTLSGRSLFVLYGIVDSFTKLNIKCGQQYPLLPKHKNFMSDSS